MCPTRLERSGEFAGDPAAVEAAQLGSQQFVGEVTRQRRQATATDSSRSAMLGVGCGYDHPPASTVTSPSAFQNVV